VFLSPDDLDLAEIVGLMELHTPSTTKLMQTAATQKHDGHD